MTEMVSTTVVLIVQVYNYHRLIISQGFWGSCSFKTAFFSYNSAVAYRIIYLWLEMKIEMSEENNADFYFMILKYLG